MSETKASQTNPVFSPRLPVLVNAEHLINLRLDALLAYEPYLDSPDKVYELHEMRIAAKRLRYTMEIFQDVYTLYTKIGTEFAQALKVVKRLQEHLGALHDADVLVPQLLEHLARLLQSGYGPQKIPVAQIPNAIFDPPSHDKHSKGAVALKFIALLQHMENLPIAGVHRVDYAGCRGLLSLCTRIRDERDLRYAQLLKEWQQIQQKQVFARLRTLLATAIMNAEGGVGETKTDFSDAAPAPISSLIEPRPSDMENAEHVTTRQESQVQRAPGEPGHIAAARRRDVGRTETGDVRAHKKAAPPKSARGRAGDPEPSAVQRAAGDGASQPTSRRVSNPRAKRHSRPGPDSGTGVGEGGTE